VKPVTGKGSIIRCWAKRNSQPAAVRQNQYDHQNVYGAACPETGHSRALIAPVVDTQTMGTFLKLFGKSIPPKGVKIRSKIPAKKGRIKTLCAALLPVSRTVTGGCIARRFSWSKG